MGGLEERNDQNTFSQSNLSIFILRFGTSVLELCQILQIGSNIQKMRKVGETMASDTVSTLKSSTL